MDSLENEKEIGSIPKSHTIMIVDDDPVTLGILATYLCDDYHVIEAHNGEEALNIIDNMIYPEEICLVISDQWMPGLSGIQFFEKLRNKIPKTLRMLMTACSDISNLIDSINKAKIYEFILKPFEPKDILLRIKRAIEVFDHQQELEISNAQKFKILSIISHDMKNLMQPLSSFTDLLFLRYDALNEEKRKDYINRIYSSKERIMALFKDSMAWAASVFKCSPEKINLADIINSTFDLYWENAKEKDINLVSYVESPCFAYADNNMIQSVVRNLIQNGIKFSYPEGKVKVTSSATDEFVTISISDNGEGINPEDLPAIWKGERTTRGTANEIGTGLGIFICKEFVEKNKGCIDINSEPGKGTCFSVSLPVREW